jgi:hypothetical protein
MPIIVNNKRIVPAPIVSFSKTPILSDDGISIGADYTLSLNGKILQNKGNPISSTGAIFSSSMSTDAWTITQSPDDDPLHGVADSDLLISTITKIEQLRALVSPPTGIKVEVVGFSHDQGIKFYGDLKSFNVDSEGNWAKPANYTMEFGFSNFIGPAISGLFGAGSSEDSFGYYVASVKENWAIQEADQVVVNTGNWADIGKVYNITHSVDAKGKRVYNSSGVCVLQPWQQASGYVGAVIGLGISNLPDSLLGITSGYYATNHKISESIDRTAGTYGVEETFSYVPSGMMPSGQWAFEECSVNIDKSEGALTNITIQGTINGIETNPPTGVQATGVSKYSNALAYYNVIEPTLYNRVKQNAGVLTWVHPSPKTTAIGKMPNAGQITYSYSYDDRPPNLISGSISEEISINDTYPGQIYSATPVIGRNQPILQYLGSRTEYKRTLSINIQMGSISRNWTYSNVDASGKLTSPTATGVRNWLITQKPSISHSGDFQVIYDAANPANEAGVIPTKVFYDAPQESWNPKSGSYSYSINWSYERS